MERDHATVTDAGSELSNLHSIGLGVFVGGILLLRPTYMSTVHPVVGWKLALGGAAAFLIRGPRGRFGMLSLVLLGVIALDVLYAFFEPRFSWGSDAIARGATLLLSPVLDRIATHDGRAFVFHEGELTEFLACSQFTGLRELAVSTGVMALLALGILGRLALSWIPPALLLLAVVAVLRFSVGVLMYVGADDEAADGAHLRIATLWSPSLTILATILVCAGGGALVRFLISVTEPRVLPAVGRRRLAFGALAAGCVGAASFLELPGEPKAGRVLLDDRLSGVWEPAGRLLDSERYGDFSAYSFATFGEFLGRRYDLTINADQPYTEELLRDYDMLVLKTPHVALGREEVEAVLRWTDEGGSLFLIGDHTDLGGMNSFLNVFATAAGIELLNDAVEHADLPGFARWEPSPWLGHPLTVGLPPIAFMTGCSLKLTGSAVPVLALRRVVAREGDYSKNSNFGSVPPRPHTPQGTLVAAAAGRIGDGRVLVFTDSTVLSSFAFFMDGHAEFVERALAWLDHRAPSVFALRSAGILAALAWLMSFPWMHRTSSRIAYSTFSMIGYCAAAVGATRVSGLCLPSAPVQDPTPVVGFVAEGGAAALPPVLGTQPEGVEDQNFMTFVQVPLRLGLETRVVPRSPSRLAGLAALVVLNPDSESDAWGADPAWLSSVRAWVREGGLLVVLAQAKHQGHAHPREGDYLTDIHARAQDCSVPGVEVLSANIGRGEIVLLRGSERFSTRSMGHCMSLPDAEQRAIYDFCHEFWRSRGLHRSISERQVYWPSPAAARGAE